MINYLTVDYKDGVLTGESPGCGCCGGDSPIEKEDLEAHIEALKEELEKAQEILADVTQRQSL